MLDPATWLHLAQELPEGSRASRQHSCGDGRKLVVDHKPNGYGAYCYRCADKGWVPKVVSLKERVARLKRRDLADLEVQQEVRLPPPQNHNIPEWPPACRAWLYKAGLSNESIAEHGIYYHARTDRVVIPVRVSGEVVFWQARSLDNGRPKYLSPEVDKPVAFFGTPRSEVVLTEDLLSAIRVGEVAFASPLLGTTVTDKLLRSLAQSDRSAALWLDPDGAGVRAARRYRATLRAYGITTRTIRSDRDPKYYSKEDITAVLGYGASPPLS